MTSTNTRDVSSNIFHSHLAVGQSKKNYEAASLDLKPNDYIWVPSELIDSSNNKLVLPLVMAIQYFERRKRKFTYFGESIRASSIDGSYVKVVYRDSPAKFMKMISWIYPNARYFKLKSFPQEGEILEELFKAYPNMLGLNLQPIDDSDDHNGDSAFSSDVADNRFLERLNKPLDDFFKRNQSYIRYLEINDRVIGLKTIRLICKSCRNLQTWTFSSYFDEITLRKTTFRLDSLHSLTISFYLLNGNEKVLSHIDFCTLGRFPNLRNFIIKDVCKLKPNVCPEEPCEKKRRLSYYQDESDRYSLSRALGKMFKNNLSKWKLLTYLNCYIINNDIVLAIVESCPNILELYAPYIIDPMFKKASEPLEAQSHNFKPTNGAVLTNDGLVDAIVKIPNLEKLYLGYKDNLRNEFIDKNFIYTFGKVISNLGSFKGRTSVENYEFEDATLKFIYNIKDFWVRGTAIPGLDLSRLYSYLPCLKVAYFEASEDQPPHQDTYNSVYDDDNNNDDNNDDDDNSNHKIIKVKGGGESIPPKLVTDMVNTGVSHFAIKKLYYECGFKDKVGQRYKGGCANEFQEYFKRHFTSVIPNLEDIHIMEKPPHAK
ncbi:hypothetical protein H4219_004047 [Mycoemilia scoparia]|uniref:Uncharacterized protein n=1 Tax=Mycoemilia scoparia TaxID=417184 RepID=A0A9W8A2D6_9FUNG|nr:hypothetical protein H4219_004047 [Mycoemilia scoparia]